MHVAVVIVGFCNADDIATCAAALGQSDYADFEVIICENGGPEAYAALTVSLPPSLPGGQKVRAVQAPGNLGYAGGINVCLRETPDADAWWILNPDTVPDPAAMSAQVERLAAGDCDAVGCTIDLSSGVVQSHGGQWQGWFARAVAIGYGASPQRAVDPKAIERTQNYLDGASMMVSRRFLEITGYLREEYFLYCEEVEWCLRGLRRGMRLGYTPGARILHLRGTTTGHVESHRNHARLPVYLNHRNTVLLTRDLFPLRLPVAIPALVAQLALGYGRRGAWRQLGYGLAGVAAGLANRRGPPDWLVAPAAERLKARQAAG
jgi:N-acetylglucosaminyl-diphospho-decaprenol L-rhamnosyltransferase